MKLINIFLLSVLFFIISARSAFADEGRYVNIVNPIRVSEYTENLSKSINSQYEIISSNELPATWLLTYDVMNDQDSIKLLKAFNENQELGLFMEITPNLSKDSSVDYNDTGAWYHASSVFLSGYEQADRVKLINTSFEKFKEVFGYYPKSVGAWWIDSFSLDYMNHKYDVIANLDVADQFSTDGYQVWGQYWSTPFYPSKLHVAMPASSISNKMDLVTLQWAPRDPMNGYFSSLYSTQDYKVADNNLNIEYFKKLLDLYTNKRMNHFGQMTIGLESDLNPADYQGEFSKQIKLVKEEKDKGEINVVTMVDFSKWYQEKFPALSPPQIYSIDDLLGNPEKVVWYQSPRYRVGLRYSYDTNEVVLFDFRSYFDNFQEPYYVLPSSEFNLSIYIPSYFDEINYNDNVWKINNGELLNESTNGDNYRIEFEKGNIVFSRDKLLVDGETVTLPEVLTDNSEIKINFKGDGYEIVPSDRFVVDSSGYVFKDLTDVATRILNRKRNAIIVSGAFTLFLIISLLIIRSDYSEKRKLVLLSLLIVPISYGVHLWYMSNSERYFVSQSEIDTLEHLVSLPEGNVLVYDNECLGCQWSSQYKPAAFANKRDYVRIWGKHPIVYNSSVFTAKDQKTAKVEFDKLDVKYIYLTKYQNYIEKVPFSPGDLGIEKVYANANAEVWKVVE